MLKSGFLMTWLIYTQVCISKTISYPMAELSSSADPRASKTSLSLCRLSPVNNAEVPGTRYPVHIRLHYLVLRAGVGF